MLRFRKEHYELSNRFQLIRTSHYYGKIPIHTYHLVNPRGHTILEEFRIESAESFETVTRDCLELIGEQYPLAVE